VSGCRKPPGVRDGLSGRVTAAGTNGGNPGGAVLQAVVEAVA
jgi:hypothetical protein